MNHDASELDKTNNDTDTDLNAGELGRADNNTDTEYNVVELDGIDNNTGVDLNASMSGGVDKNTNIEYNTSKVNNRPDIDKTNNVEKEVKVYKSNLFWLLLISNRSWKIGL